MTAAAVMLDPIRVRPRDQHSLVELRAVGGVDAGRIWFLGMGTHTLGPALDSTVVLRGAHARRPGVRLTVTATGEAWLAIPEPRSRDDALPPEPGAPSVRSFRPMDPAGTPWASGDESGAQDLRWPEGAQLSIYGTRLSLGRVRSARRLDPQHFPELDHVEREVLFERAVRCAEVPDPASLAQDVVGRRSGIGQRDAGAPGHLQLRIGSADGASRAERWTIPGLPCAVDLAEARVLGVSGNPEPTRALARWLVVQAATHCSPEGLGIRVFADPTAGRSWDWAARLPHVASGQGDAQAATDPRDVGRNIGELAAEFAARAAADLPGKPILAVFDRASMLRQVDGVVEILRRGPELGIYALCVDTLDATVPECRVVLRCSTDELAMKDRAGITPDLVGVEWCARVAGSIG